MVTKKQIVQCRGTFIKQVANKLGSKSYLEIGLSENPKAPYRLIDVQDKTSVDMREVTNPDFCMSSDDFFKNLNNGLTKFDKDKKWDLIFIDGDHFAEQVYEDLCNSFDHLSENGVIFLHDSLPWRYDMTIEWHVGSKQATCQDAWKVIEYCLKEREDMHVCTIEESGGGLGVITKSKSPRKEMLSKSFNRFYQYGVYDRDKFTKMNCIQPTQVLEWVSNPRYSFYQD